MPLQVGACFEWLRPGLSAKDFPPERTQAQNGGDLQATGRLPMHIGTNAHKPMTFKIIDKCRTCENMFTSKKKHWRGFTSEAQGQSYSKRCIQVRCRLNQRDRDVIASFSLNEKEYADCHSHEDIQTILRGFDMKRLTPYRKFKTDAACPYHLEDVVLRQS